MVRWTLRRGAVAVFIACAALSARPGAPGQTPGGAGVTSGRAAADADPAGASGAPGPYRGAAQAPGGAAPALAGEAPAAAAGERALRAGAAVRDITPPPGLPLWGYGGRKDLPARGTRDPLFAAALVLSGGGTRIAVVGLDLGRAPARSTVASIEETVRRRAAVDRVFLVGSHTHHGPCPELVDVEPTASWVRTLRERVVEAIAEAARSAVPVRWSVACGDVRRNRNRHSRLEPVPVDRRLRVLRAVAASDGAPVATLVNFSAHPTTLPASLLRWSADYPGALRRRVEERLGGVCVFVQGACGDMSCDLRGLDTEAFGEALADEAVRLVRRAEPHLPRDPAIRVEDDRFRFESRVRLDDPLRYLAYSAAFFPALVDAYVEEYRDGIRPRLTVAVLPGKVGIVGVSGEFFAAHAIRLRARARLRALFFLGCCNGYHQYFPTIEAVAEGGYGAAPDVAPAEVGAGEHVMHRALERLYELRGLLDG